MSAPYRLWHAVDTRSLRVLWTLEELGLGAEVDVRILPFPPGSFEPAYLEVNPIGSVPYFEHGNVRMSESMAICEYLTARHGSTSLVVGPEEPEYGDYRQFLWFGEATLMAPLGVLVQQLVLRPPERRDANAIEAARASLAVRSGVVGARLANTAYLACNRFTLADISVGYALHLAALLDRSLLSPATAVYLDFLASRPSFAKARSRAG